MNRLATTVICLLLCFFPKLQAARIADVIIPNNVEAKSHPLVTSQSGDVAIILSAPLGPLAQGRVICFSPHHEMTAGLEAFVQDVIEYAKRKRAQTVMS